MKHSTATKRAPQCSECGCDSQGNLPRRLWTVGIALLLGIVLIRLISSHEGPGANASISSPSHEGFAPTIQNAVTPPQKERTGMAWIPGGEFSMGCKDPRMLPDGGGEPMADARPIHRVYVDGFWMDRTDVTNAEYARFVKQTGYITVAERKPRAEDFPGAPAEKLVPGSLVFTPPSHPVPLDDYSQWWSYVPGANWRHPLGPKSSIRGRENDPVVHAGFRCVADRS